MFKNFLEDSRKKENEEESKFAAVRTRPSLMSRLLTSKWIDRMPGKKIETLLADKVSKEPLKLEAGSIALYGEGDMQFVNYILKPAGDSSGVSIGKGYDMGSRSEEEIIKELTNAGVLKVQAEKISKAAYKKGKDADLFVQENKENIGKISDEVILNLFKANWNDIKADTKKIATSHKAQKDGKGNYLNARGREINDGVKEGTYVLSEEEWNSLHPALIDLMTDMKFHGGYYIYDRAARVNKAIKEHPNDQLGQLKAVRELFTNGYIETYTQKLSADGSFNKVKHDTTDVFFGKKVNLKGKYKRDQIRLTFLDTVIEALEAGREVEIGGVSSKSSASLLKTTTTNPVSIISDTVGLHGKNKPDDVRKIQQLLYKAGFNISINGEVDTAMIQAIKDFQKIKSPASPSDGLVSPGKNIEKYLAEYSNSYRIQPLLNESYDAPKENVVIQAYENYKNGAISMVTLGSKLKENNYFFPKTTLSVFNSLPTADRDNLAFTMANQCSDAELKEFNIEVLVMMEDVLDTYLHTTSWRANAKQEGRVEQVLKEKGRITSYLTKSKIKTETQEKPVVTTFPNIASVGLAMTKENRYQKGRAYINTNLNGKSYKSGDLIEGSGQTWCNQFAMDLAKKVTKDNPFKNIPGGQGNALVDDMIDFMVANPSLFKELKIPLEEVWEKEINKGQLIFFIEPTHVATGVPTEKKDFISFSDASGKKWVCGNVVQAGNHTELFSFGKAWKAIQFRDIRYFKYLGK